MNIMVLAGNIPATAGMAGSPRLFNLCRVLSRQHRLTLVTGTRSQERYADFLKDPATAGVFHEVVVLPGPPDPDWWGQQQHRLRQEAHFVTRWRTPTHHAAQHKRIRDAFVQGACDLLYVDGLAMAQYVMSADLRCPAVIDIHDCMTLLYSRTTKIERRWWRKLALHAETRSYARWERSLSRVFNAVITNSRVDEMYFKKLDPGANTLTIGNGVDSAFFEPGDAESEMPKLIFTGVMSYGPNEDAAIYFCEAILPLIQQRYPHVQFWVVGKDPTEKVRRLADRPGVHVTGTVPDVRPYLWTAGIFVCPLRYGTGIKNKLLAALAMQKPSVATPVSVEGLDLRDKEDLLIANGPKQFASGVFRLLEDPAYAQRLGQNGRKFVVAKYSWEGSARLLEDTLYAALRAYKAAEQNGVNGREVAARP